MLTNENSEDINNMFLAEPLGDKPIVTLEYALYINCGRPNHNPSRVMNVAKCLQGLGYGVQLAHNPDENERHYVSLSVNGMEFVRHQELQHNTCFRENMTFSQELVTEFDTKILEGYKPKPKEADGESGDEKPGSKNRRPKSGKADADEEKVVSSKTSSTAKEDEKVKAKSAKAKIEKVKSKSSSKKGK